MSKKQTYSPQQKVDAVLLVKTIGLTKASEELQKARETIKQQEKEIARIAKENKFLQEASIFFVARRVK